MSFEGVLQDTPIVLVDQVEQRPAYQGVLEVSQKRGHRVGHVQDTTRHWQHEEEAVQSLGRGRVLQLTR